MTAKSQSANAETVQVIEADVLDTMNETNSLIAQRAYEIFQSRGGEHGSDQDDWFSAEGEFLPKLAIDYDVTDSTVQLSAQVPGFAAKDLEVAVGIDGRLFVVSTLIHVRPQAAAANTRRLCGSSSSPLMLIPKRRRRHSTAELCRLCCRAHKQGS